MRIWPLTPRLMVEKLLRGSLATEDKSRTPTPIIGGNI